MHVATSDSAVCSALQNLSGNGCEAMPAVQKNPPAAHSHQRGVLRLQVPAPP